MIQLALYQYYGELFFIRKQKNIVNQALIRRYQICYTLQKTTHYRSYAVNHIRSAASLESWMVCRSTRALRDSDGDIYDIVAGNFFIVGLGQNDFTDLPHELAERFAEQFRQPELFLRVDGKIVAAPMPDEQVQGGMSY